MMHTKIDDRCVRFKVTHGLNGYQGKLLSVVAVDLPGMSVCFFVLWVSFTCFFFSEKYASEELYVERLPWKTGAFLFPKHTSGQFCSDQSAGYVTLKGGDCKGILPNMCETIRLRIYDKLLSYISQKEQQTKTTHETSLIMGIFVAKARGGYRSSRAVFWLMAFILQS